MWNEPIKKVVEKNHKAHPWILSSGVKGFHVTLSSICISPLLNIRIIESTLNKEIETLSTSILDSIESPDTSNKIKSHLHR